MISKTRASKATRGPLRLRLGRAAAGGATTGIPLVGSAGAWSSIPDEDVAEDGGGIAAGRAVEGVALTGVERATAEEGAGELDMLDDHGGGTGVIAAGNFAFGDVI